MRFGRFAIKLRYPGSDFVCFVAESARQGGGLRSTLEPPEVAWWGTVADAAKWLEGRGLTECRPVPGCGWVPVIEPFDPSALSPPPWWLRGSLSEPPPVLGRADGRPAPTPAYVRPAPKSAPAPEPVKVQTSLF